MIKLSIAYVLAVLLLAGCDKESPFGPSEIVGTATARPQAVPRDGTVVEPCADGGNLRRPCER